MALQGAYGKIKHYTKGYSDVQTKVSDATSNSHSGPSGTQMNEIAQMTYNQQDFVEIMEMLDKRLNDKGKNWRHVFKALTLLDYLLHAGSENVVLYFRDNLYIIKTLKEFQYIDEDMKDQGANVRQKARDITALFMEEGRLRDHRRNRATMNDSMVNGEMGDMDVNEDEGARRRSQSVPARSNGAARRTQEEDEDLQKALELSKQSLADEQARLGRMTAEERDIEEALRRSKDEENARLKAVEDSNSRALFDEGTQLAPPNSNVFPLVDTSAGPSQGSLQSQFTANPYWQQPQLAAQQQQQAEYEWMLQQQQLQAVQAQQQAQSQQEEWLRQQMIAQQQQLQAQQFFQQQQQQPPPHSQGLFATSPIQIQPTGYGSNNPFALGGASASTPALPSFGSTASPSSSSPALRQPSALASSSFTAPSPQPPPSPTTANTLANARRPTVANDGKHADLANLFANRVDDGVDSFGNVGNLRFGNAYAGQVQQNATGTNPFSQQQRQNEQPFFQV